jgi:hypothetical protein
VRYRTDTAAAQRHAPCALPLGLATFLAMDCLLGPARTLKTPRGERESKCGRTFTTPAHLPMWIAGTFISLIAVLGIAATLRWTPASYANIPDDGALSRHGAVPSGSEDAQAIDAQAQLDVAGPTVNRRSRVWCDECGGVESYAIKGSGDVGRRNTIVAAVGGDVSSRQPTERSPRRAERRRAMNSPFAFAMDQIRFNDTVSTSLAVSRW